MLYGLFILCFNWFFGYLGKTVTLVEAIKQIEKSQASCNILACAPSNSAADLLCRKILEHVDEHKVHRMYASSRDPKYVPEELKVSGGCLLISSDCKWLMFQSMIFDVKHFFIQKTTFILFIHMALTWSKLIY